MKYYNDLPEIENCDIVVGIPSFNNAETIAYVAEQAARGITELGLKGTVVNSDGGSNDGTREAFMKANTLNIPKHSLVYKGIPGKGSAIRALFEFAHKANAKVFVMLDSDLRSVKPWWIERLANPILSGKTSYVTPLYVRHKYDGTITNNICYPLISVLFGKKIRQPIGGDFGVGKELIDVYLSKNVWETDVAKFGIDIWMSVTAVVESSKKPVQAALGAKVHDVKDPGKHLVGMFLQVVRTLFDLVALHLDKLDKFNEIEQTDVYGSQVQEKVEEIVIDLENLKNRAKQNLAERLHSLDYIPKAITGKILSTGKLTAEEWAEVVFESLVLYRKNKDEDIVMNLLPFYFARVAGFVEETFDLTSEQAEKVIEAQLEVFKTKKTEYAKRW
ncbi:glycosyltransferase [Pseudothermotoga thermarum]|uniref:Glycosyl transferase family 2 n=1 Tax=Pseudothermotoga thermarum DSM 5069 TaxID=688269 RepID=F7YVL7_9THEM|nr:glycosyltransferase [Pseudothermotoga thermarum]AEH51677.1 glycosyl transferase family 2 [Pseudothermotoga thermarum DSM 5069]